MPKSVLRYDVDKDLTSIWYSVFTLSCFPNKKTDRRRRAKQFFNNKRLVRERVMESTFSSPWKTSFKGE